MKIIYIYILLFFSPCVFAANTFDVIARNFLTVPVQMSLGSADGATVFSAKLSPGEVRYVQNVYFPTGRYVYVEDGEGFFSDTQSLVNSERPDARPLVQVTYYNAGYETGAMYVQHPFDDDASVSWSLAWQVLAIGCGMVVAPFTLSMALRAVRRGLNTNLPLS